MEEDIKLQVCRLCFNLISNTNFLPIKSSLKDMLQVVTTELNLDKTSNPVMCDKCSKVLQEIFVFKTNFFESEERIETKMSTMNNVKLDLRDMSNFCKRPSRKSKKINVQNVRVCRTCLKAINKKKFIDLSPKTNARLSSVLKSCIPEMDLSLTNNPIMCQICYDTLQKMECFKSLCAINESKIDAFSRTMHFNRHDINLYQVLQFLRGCSVPDYTIAKFDNRTDSSNYTTIKIECNTEETERDKCLKFVDCLECVAVKMEPSDDDQANENEINLKRRRLLNRSQSSRSGTQKPKKINNKCETRSLTYCTDCNFKTKYKYNLRRHLIITHKRKDMEVNKKFYQCVHCSFSTKWNIDLTRHLLSHIKPEALKCTKCPYSTNQNSQLIKHILSHVNADNIDKYRFLQLTKKS